MSASDQPPRGFVGRVPLARGGVLAYAEYGNPHGKPVLYCHGCPGSRLEAALAQPGAIELGLRIVAPDRPGYGATGRQQNRTLADWPGDVTALADALQLDRFAVLGISGGAPYALACAALLPERVTGAGIVCGLGPMATAEDRRSMRLLARASLGIARRRPDLGHLLIGEPLAWLARRQPERILTWLAAMAPPVDRKALRKPKVRKTLSASLREAFAQDGQGTVQDLALYSQPWPMDIGQITVGVHLWHGEQDATVPVAVGRRLAASLPRCQPRFLPGEGHYSLPVKHLRAILVAVAG